MRIELIRKAGPCFTTSTVLYIDWFKFVAKYNILYYKKENNRTLYNCDMSEVIGIKINGKEITIDGEN